jgi:hypothetical protein
MSKFDADVGLGARDSERRPAARTDRALSTGPCFSLVKPGERDSLLPGRGDCVLGKEEVFGLPELPGAAEV